MKSSLKFDRWIMYSIIVVLVGAIAFLIFRYLNLEERRISFADLGLERAQQMYRIRLDGLFHELAEDLNEEAAALLELDTQNTTNVIQRWRPLLQTHWPIIAISLADENGNETALVRKGNNMELQLTSEGSSTSTMILADVSNDPNSGIMDSVWISDLQNDPRENLWFSKALEDSRNEAAWNLHYLKDQVDPVMEVSLLVRNTDRSNKYRILAFTVALSRAEALVTNATSIQHYGTVLLSNSGNKINTPDSASISPEMDFIEAEACRTWQTDQIQWPRTFQHEGKSYRALVTPYKLNGQTICTGVIVDLASMNRWILPERNSLIGFTSLLTLLIGLLTYVRIRRGKEMKQMRKQVKRTRMQEKRLAKALGERDVLNREVHHRVKNNLQVLSSLLNLQGSRLDEGEIRDEFMRGKQRIDTIALVHHKLYEMQDLRNVDLHYFLTNLIASLAQMHQPASNSVSYEISTSGLKADQDTAIELGIITTELVTNIYRHAFPYVTGGHVDLQITHVEGDLYRFVVKDNGRGLPEGYKNSGKLGLEIVSAMADQLGGSIHIRTTNEGVTFEIVFRMSYKPEDPEKEEEIEI